MIFQGETADSSPGVKCLHAHCAERSLKEVLETFDEQKTGSDESEVEDPRQQKLL